LNVKIRKNHHPLERKPRIAQQKFALSIIDVHLTRAHEGISCTWAACCNVPKFTEATEFLAQAINVRS
jgi:hypothetical protein